MSNHSQKINVAAEALSCDISNAHDRGLCCTKIEHVSVISHKTVILEDINLHIHCGELTAVVGRNGAGKTTFLRSLLGEVRHTGCVRFTTATGGEYRKPRFGYVPQRLHIDSGTPVSVSDLVVSCLSSYPAWFPRKKTHKHLVHDVLCKTSAEMLAERRLCDLSGGELQRIMLSLAITPSPDILLLDEPVSGIDRAGLKLFYELVSRLRTTHDMSIILVSHDLDLVAHHADRVVLLDKTLRAEGPPATVFADPAFIEIFGTIAIS